MVQILSRSNNYCKLEDGIEVLFIYLWFSVILVFVALICNIRNKSFVNVRVNVLDYLI